MKKKLTFGFVFSTIAMSLGLTSCKSECKSCVVVEDYGTFCVGEMYDGKPITQANVDYYISKGNKHPKKCK